MRVNGGSNYEYPVQRKVPKLVNLYIYIFISLHLSLYLPILVYLCFFEALYQSLLKLKSGGFVIMYSYILHQVLYNGRRDKMK